MKYLFVISLCLLILSQNTFAQRGESRKQRWEKFRAEKVAFLTSNLDLTPEEAQKFWPIYNQMEKERQEAQDQRREVERKVQEAGGSMSKKEIVDLTREFTSTMKHEGALISKYNEEFLKILPPEKVLKIYQSENEFRMKIFKRYRDQNSREKED